MKPRLYRINCYFCESLLVFTFRYYSQSLDIIRKVFNTLFLRARKCFLLIINVLYVIAIIIIIIFKVFSKHLNLNNAPRNSDLYHYRNLSTVWNDFTRMFRSRSHVSRFSEKFSSKHSNLNNNLENSDLYYYRNLSIIWNDFIRSCNNHMYLETFFSIETLFSHIFFDLQLPDFWCASDNYQNLFSKYRFLTKSEIFVW